MQVVTNCIVFISCMIFVTLFLYWQVPYPTGHNPYGSNEHKINWNWNTMHVLETKENCISVKLTVFIADIFSQNKSSAIYKTRQNRQHVLADILCMTVFKTVCL